MPKGRLLVIFPSVELVPLNDRTILNKTMPIISSNIAALSIQAPTLVFNLPNSFKTVTVIYIEVAVNNIP